MRSLILLQSFRLAAFGMIAVAATLGAANAKAGGDIDARLYETRSVPVRFGDLDLQRTQGIETLYRRIEAAAERACGERESRNLQMRADWGRCYREALERAVEGVSNARLAERHRSGVPATDQRSPLLAAHATESTQLPVH